MNAQNIRRLVEVLPEDSRYFGKPPGVKTSEPERLAMCLNDPKFGWNFVESFIRSRIELPLDACIYDHLRRLYVYHVENEYDPAIAEAISLTSPQNTRARDILKALLVCQDITLQGIAEWMRLSEAAVKLFQQLFFNYRDRLGEPGYITALIYPEGKSATFRADYLERESSGQRLLRMGYEHGADRVASIIGYPPNAGGDEPTEMLCDEFVRLSVKNGVNLAQQGYLNAKDAPGIKVAAAFAALHKKVRETGQTPDEIMGLGAISAGQSVMDTVMKMQEPEILHRRRLQRQMLEREEAEKAAAKKD